MKSWILEINDNPTLNTIMCTGVMGCKHDNCPTCEVDLYVKKRILKDSIKLAFKSRSQTNI